ncbi:MAG: hypothetical protein GX799_06215 [Crenarchaeota archaeon]|jgi:putative NADPH-quinone reductase|nr:hypothetical protein [Thermoproteota archaeon]
MPPASIVDCVDSVFRIGLAYHFQEIAPGIGVLVVLLKAKKDMVFNTSNTPHDSELLKCKAAIDNLWKACIFDICCLNDVERHLLEPINTSTQQDRERRLRGVVDAIKSQFPA